MSIISGEGEMTVDKVDQVVVLVMSVVRPSALVPWMVVVEGEPVISKEIDLASATRYASEVITEAAFEL